MKQEDLIKRLENLETPEIELLGHKQTLKIALLDSGHFKQRTIMDRAKVLVPVTAAVAVMMVLGFFNLIQPALQVAQAREIAGNDPQVQALMKEHNLGIVEVELQDGEAFVLLAAPRAFVEASSESLCSKTARIVSDFFSWAWRSAIDETSFPPPSEVEPRLPDEESFMGYILQIDLLEKKVSGLGEVDRAAALREIDLGDIDFAKLEP